MACKYHPKAVSAGRRAACGSEFCAECGVPFTTGRTECLDCAARYARKKISQSYIAVGIGLVGGLFAGIFVAVDEGGLWILLIPILPIWSAYSFFSVIWGWHYGGRAWPWLGRIVHNLEGGWAFVVGYLFLLIRLMFSSVVGFFISIPSFLECKNIIKRQEQLAMNPHTA